MIFPILTVEPSLEDGETAVMALNPERAEEMFARVFRDETADPEDRAKVGQAGNGLGSSHRFR